MYVSLHENLAQTDEGKEAQSIISACVHCGFCLATCPTYIDSGDERDSPRGRIYLIKQLLETDQASSQTQLHLDRCLTCRSCETTCPSGVRYGRLLDVGRGLVEQKVPRPLLERSLRSTLRTVLSRPRWFATLLKLGQSVRPVLPANLQSKIPEPTSNNLDVVDDKAQPHSRTMLVLDGCVTASATPKTNAAARKVLGQLGINLTPIERAGCCGAVNHHLGAHTDALKDMRRNIDAWWPAIEAGAEAVISTASGCGAMLVDYGELLAKDAHYAEKARHISALCRDISEVLLNEDLSHLTPNTDVGKVAVHTPCTLQHALKLPEAVPTILARAGFDLAVTTEKHLCCGSAGTYSILQPEISQRLLKNKRSALNIDQPDIIATANVGCQLQLGGEEETPVVHWIELLAAG
ncbi:MAG: glycolate oxidase subunit GlcF [Halioglobus sp.]